MDHYAHLVKRWIQMNNEIIIGWILYKIHWEKLKIKGEVITSNEKSLTETINKMMDKDYKINLIEFIYVREE
jgi:hypothetical protein